MKEFYRRGKRLFVAFLCALLMISQLGIFSPVTAYAQETEGNEYQTAEVKATKAATKADGTTVLTFTSDIHNSSNNTAANRLGDWLTKVRSQYGEIESMNFCGDMGAAQGNGNTWWGYVQSVMDVVDSKGIPGVYTTGNHEFMNGSYTPTTNAQARKYIVGDVGREGDNYVIYCLGTDNWNNNQDNITTGQVDKLKTFLNSRNTDKPIIVLVHFPLHTCSSGSWGGRTTQNADLVIDALNAGAAKGQKIILLWGHNHTMSDPLYDQVFVPNDQIEYKSGSKKTIGFYYGAAGCMSDSEYGTGSAYVKGKGLVLTIDNEDKITMTYLNANGTDVTEGGAFKEDGSVTPYNPGGQDDPSTDPQSGIPESGKKYVILASDGYALTSEGEEVGYSNAGSGTQRYNYKGLTGKQYNPGEDVIPDDLLWNFISTGTKADNGYYIQSNDGKYYLVGEYVSNSTGGYDGTLKLSTTEKDEWILTAPTSGSTVNGNLLKSTNASQSAAGDKFLAHGNLSSSSSSGNTNIFSLRSRDNATASSFYEYNDDGTYAGGGSTPVVPTGDTVNITPTTDNPEQSISIKVGDTLTINTTNGSSSNAYDFTATVANSSIAQIQGSSTANIAAGGKATFTVKGLAKGTTDITIQNSNTYGSQYTRKGVIHLTVTDGGSTPVDPTTEDSVDITPTTDNPEKSISVKVGDTFDINVTNSSSNSAYDFTATVGNSSIAQIQGNSTVNIGMGATKQFTVKGLAKGTTDITIQNTNQYGSQYVRKCVIHVTVVEGAPHEHTWDDGKETTPATCTEAGVKTFTCTGCGETRTETIEALGHDWEETVKEATCTEAGEKTTTCKRCGESTTEEIPAIGHDYGDWQVRTAATCTDAGTRYRICKNCGNFESEQIPALGHEYQEVEGSAKAATCTDAGKEADQKCARCGDEQTGKEIPALGHDWTEWETRLEPTETATGLKVRHCSRCLKLETEDIPKITPSKPDDTPTPDQGSKDDPKKEESKSTVPTTIPAEISPTNPVSAASVDKQILNAKTDADPKGSVFNLLQAKGVAKSKTSIKVSWTKVKGAKKYIIYGNKCGTKNRFKKIKEVTGTSFTQKKLKKGTYYKYLIVAVNGNKALATSKTIHAATKGGKVGNNKSVTTKAKNNKVTLKKGKTFKLGAKAAAENKKLKVKKHRAIAYESANKKVATISAKGVIKGVKKGTCYVYAYAQNGVCKKIKVTVK